MPGDDAAATALVEQRHDAPKTPPSLLVQVRALLKAMKV
jgi:hypothetical protein